MKRTVITAVLVALAAVAPCQAESLSGSYRTENGKHSLTFSSDGTVKTTLFGQQLQTKYSTKGGKVSFAFPGGMPLTYTIEKDSLTHVTLQRYKKL